MDESAYYRTAIPEPWTILGLRLRPFALGHVLILHRFESPLVSDISKAISGDLLFAVFVCSHTYEEGLSALDDEGLFNWISDWSRKLCRPTWRQRIGLSAPVSIDWPAKFKSFIEYMSAGSHYPVFSFPESRQPSDTGLPLVQVVKCVLLTKTGLTESQIMNRPWGLALTDYITIRAMEGAVHLIDSGMIEAARSQAEEFENRLNHGGNHGA